MLRSVMLVSSYKVFLSFLFFILFNGCSGLEKECKSINWHDLGRRDSVLKSGFKKELEKRRKTCPIKHDSVYMKAYKNGFLFGIKEYCNFKTGYSYGLAKTKTNISSCPKNSQFSEGYDSGVKFSEIKSLKKDLETKLSKIQSQLKEAGLDIQKKSNPPFSKPESSQSKENDIELIELN